jgi:ADP-ribosylglycohydrolase
MKPPIPNSYWVEPGRVLAGEHPDGGSDAATRRRTAALLAAGVRYFIDLTEPDELPDYRGLLPEGVGYQRFPMPDHSLPRSAAQMRGVQDALARLIAASGAVYVHCRAGIGRTGMTIGCYLREQGQEPLAALQQLNRLWQQNARAARWPSIPETQDQERYILEWRPGVREDGDRLRGCLIGLAVGDVIASAPGSAAAGWSDETGMAICTAESLLARGGFDGRDQLDRLRAWDKDPVSQGAAAGAALRPVVREVLARALWNRSAVTGSHDPSQEDASPLTRCAAAAVVAAGRRLDVQALAEDVVRVTHQMPVSVDACRLYTAMLAAALGGASRPAVLQAALNVQPPPRPEVSLVARDWSGPAVGRRRPAPGILGALDRTVRSFLRGSNFGAGLDRALAGPQSGRSSAAASYGALAGAWYGAAAIPAELQARVAGRERLEDLAQQILDAADAGGGPLP